MQNNTEYTSDNFIARWISGEVTEKEVNDLSEFMRKEPDAIRFFEDIKQAWFGINPPKLPRGVSHEKRWSKLKRRLNLKFKNNSQNDSH